MIIVMLGPQGSGKGTQGTKLSEHLNIPHISTGSLLREYVSSGGSRAQEVSDILNSGRLVSDEFLIEILGERITAPDCANGYILDGTPRNLEQARILDTVLSVDHAFLIDITEEESFKRIQERARIEGRSDDTPEALKKRLHTYFTETLPVVKLYEEENVLHDIDGMQTIDEVFTAILSCLEK